MRAKLLQSIGDRRLSRRAGGESHVLHHSQQHHGHADVQHSADNQGGNDSEG